MPSGRVQQWQMAVRGAMQPLIRPTAQKSHAHKTSDTI